MTTLLRHLTEADWEAYRDLRLTALSEASDAFASSADEQSGMTPDDWRAAARNESHSFVLAAFEGESMIGMVGLTRERRRKTRHKATVRGLYVRPDERGRGVARLLLAALLREVEGDTSLEQLILSVTSTNTAARTLYERLGFTSYGSEPHALKIGDRYLDDELMILFLRASEKTDYGADDRKAGTQARR